MREPWASGIARAGPSFRSPQNFAKCQAKRNEIRPNISFRFVSFCEIMWYRISFRFVFTGSPQAELGAFYINKASKMIDFSRGCPRASASNLWSHFVSFRFVLRQAPGAALPFRFVSFRFGRKRMFRFISSWKRRASSGKSLCSNTRVRPRGHPTPPYPIWLGKVFVDRRLA